MKIIVESVNQVVNWPLAHTVVALEAMIYIAYGDRTWRTKLMPEPLTGQRLIGPSEPQARQRLT